MANARAKSRRSPQQNPLARGGKRAASALEKRLEEADRRAAEIEKHRDYLLEQEAKLCELANAESKAKVAAEKRAQDAEERAKTAENRTKDSIDARLAEHKLFAQRLEQHSSTAEHFRMIAEPCGTHLEIQLRKAAEETRDAAKLAACWIVDQAGDADAKHQHRVNVRTALDAALASLRYAGTIIRQNDLT